MTLKKTLSLFGNTLRNQLTFSTLFKLLCISCTVYLVTLEVRSFLVERPTLTSSEIVDYKSSDFPEVTICSNPSFNETIASELGYSVSYFYRGTKGVLTDPTFTGKEFQKKCIGFQSFSGFGIFFGILAF